MLQAIKQFRPSSSWISTGLLTVFMLSFGVFAQAHKPVVNDDFLCGSTSVAKTQLFVRYH